MLNMSPRKRDQPSETRLSERARAKLCIWLQTFAKMQKYVANGVLLDGLLFLLFPGDRSQKSLLSSDEEGMPLALQLLLCGSKSSVPSAL
jgi:hypothetical protein